MPIGAHWVRRLNSWPRHVFVCQPKAKPSCHLPVGLVGRDYWGKICPILMGWYDELKDIRLEDGRMCAWIISEIGAKMAIIIPCPNMQIFIICSCLLCLHVLFVYSSLTFNQMILFSITFAYSLIYILCLHWLITR
jgi:hypothetical protein